MYSIAAKGGGDDDAKGAFGTDEQVDEIHARACEEAGGELRHRWHDIRGDGYRQ
jgi:hypothetical protein